jgi:hypothetical protein
VGKFRHGYFKDQRPLFGGASWAALGKMIVSGLQNRLNYCVIVMVCT